MKFLSKNIKSKKLSSELTVHEYCSEFNNLSMDGAIADLNGKFGPKINKNFTELLFILSGKLFVQDEGNVHELKKHDMYIISPDNKHTLIGENCSFFISCNPQFKPENIEFVE